MLTFIILICFGILSGLLAILFGFGGGFIIVPLLYHLSGAAHNQYSMHIAVSTSVVIMIINSLNTTVKSHRHNKIIWPMILPLILYIAIGAILGVFIAQFISSKVIHWLFIIFMLYTIVTCINNKKFVQHSDANLKLITKSQHLWLGLIIGAISSILGVGGSLMTVPLLRNFGVKMANAVAMANPLSLAVALISSIGYSVLALSHHIDLGKYYLGFIYLPALLLLTTGGSIGILIGHKLSDFLSDRLHAKIYIASLILVFLIMLI
ncbi:MAG: sulfite exporter TauE/SafE family protein [Burkholderiales bacterium]|jgi:uncharacterized membrane protein YfcA|nr:sulfite exporter TauE/SafE family protein [Burkholderiales bacterium]